MYNMIIIDSDTESATKLKNCLDSEGYNVLTVDTGEKGLKVLDAWIPDVLVVDTSLIDMNGLDLLQEVKQKDLSSNIPTIVVSQSDDQKTKEMAMELGATDFITKPLDFEYVLGKIDSMVKLVATAFSSMLDNNEEYIGQRADYIEDEIEDDVIEENYMIANNVVLKLGNNEVKVADETFMLGKREFGAFKNIIKSGGAPFSPTSMPESLRAILGYGSNSGQNDFNFCID